MQRHRDRLPESLVAPRRRGLALARQDESSENRAGCTPRHCTLGCERRSVSTSSASIDSRWVREAWNAESRRSCSGRIDTCTPSTNGFPSTKYAACRRNSRLVPDCHVVCTHGPVPIAVRAGSTRPSDSRGSTHSRLASASTSRNVALGASSSTRSV